MYEIYRDLRGGTKRLRNKRLRDEETRDEETKGLVFLIILKYYSSLSSMALNIL